jgi:molybdenum cofactor cytidylyltransferase
MTVVVILAAGSSSRLGKPKQNLIYRGNTLLQSAVASALSVSAAVIVILGASIDAISPTIKDQQITVLYNQQWEEGMASSIRLAISHLQSNYPQAGAVIFMLCDQPYADAALLQSLTEASVSSNKRIIASSYSNTTIGVPALFKANYFPSLLVLKGHEGAKKLFKQHADDLTSIPFPLGNIDIDTMTDFDNLLLNE